ncbi:MAG: 5-formyltetrahydrofolate cyclo-ligase [Kofleriaceae bacterium]
MSSSDSSAAKPVARRTVLARRDALAPYERELASARIAERVNDLIADRRTVALYAPKGSEVETWLIDEHVRASGGRVVYPRVVSHTRELEFHETVPEQLVVAKFGLREPRADWRNIVGLVEIDAFIVPGLAFDRRGGRIGWGGGHYDATLAAASPNALRIGLAFDIQMIESVARDAHDVDLSQVVTETTTYEVR